jgi:carboxylesterase type B
MVSLYANQPCSNSKLVQSHPILHNLLLTNAGNVLKGIESIIISHVNNEGKMFVPKDTSDAAFSKLLNYLWGGSPGVVEAIKEQYASTKFPSTYQRYETFLGDSTFLCTTRYITEAYPNKTYNVIYSLLTGTHGTDVPATFYSLQGFLENIIRLRDTRFGDMASKYQAYLISHARTGNPNHFKKAGTIDWPIVERGPVFGNVLNVTENGFGLVRDSANSKKQCDFWVEMMAELRKRE